MRRVAVPSPGELLIGLILASIGMGYFVYGRKNGRVLALACGLLLMVFPYAVAGFWPQVGIGVVLMALPCLFR